MNNIIKKLSVCLVLTCLLQGCWTAASTSAQVVYNRQGWIKMLDDQYITLQAFRALKIKSTEFNDANIAIATFNYEVLLVGQVPSLEEKRRAESIVRTIPNIETLYNLLTVGSPSSSLTRINDTWLTGKVKTQYMTSDIIDPSHIKVVTENGVVYLMGMVTPEEAKEAVEIASNTRSVQKVVTLFSYVTISKKKPV